MPGENDFVTKCPEAVEMWDYSNNSIDPTTIHPNSRREAFFKCKNGHEFSKVVAQFYRTPICHECELQERNILLQIPDIIIWWDYEKNDKNLPEKHYKNESKSVWWKCPKCEYSWQSEIATRANSKLQCPCCDLGIAFKEGVNDALTRCPDIGLDWDYELNGELKPNNIFLYHKRIKGEIHWKCHLCNYKWTTKTLGTRVRFENNVANLRKCPSCSGRVTNENTDNIKKTHPEIAFEYVEELNDTPVTNIRYGSAKKRIWRCSICGQIYPARTVARTNTKHASGCPYCAGRYPIVGVNDFATMHPEFLSEWDYNLNNKGPQEYTEFSGARVNWICKNDKTHKWKIQIEARSKGKGRCPICYNTKILKKSMLTDARPDLLQYWDFEKNELPPNSYTVFSNRKAWWKCKNGHQIYMEIYQFTRASFYCSVCNDRKLKGVNDILTHFPEIESIWDYNGNNRKMPGEIVYHRNQYHNFICKKGHKWRSSLNKIIKNNYTCDYCEGRKALQGFNTIKAIYQNLSTEYSKRNKNCNPDNILANNKSQHIWTCSICNTEWYATILERLNGERSCPGCNGVLAIHGKTSFKALYPELVKEYSKDNIKNSDDILPSYGMSVKWYCFICNMEWYASVKDRINGSVDCPYCTGRKAIPGKTSLKALYPELIKEYSLQNDYDPDLILPTYYIPMKWKCSLCDMEWVATIKSRINGGAICPYCTGRKAIPGCTSFKALYPELANEFSRNNEYDPDQLIPTHSLPMKWECTVCTMEWETSIRNRVNGDEKCPYCDGRKAIPGITSFKSLYPEVMQEWKYLSNLLLANPDIVLPSSSKEVWWKCSHCHKSYSLKINEKVNMYKRHKKTCPYCKGYRKRKRRYM